MLCRDSRLPTLPTSLNTFGNDDISADDISESGSDFFPDWSSVDSYASSIGSRRSPIKFERVSREEIFLNDEDFMRLNTTDVEIVTDDEENANQCSDPFSGTPSCIPNRLCD